MKLRMKYVSIVLAALAGVISLAWVLAANDLAMFGFFAPKQEQIRRNVYEQSRAFNEGMQQELEQMRLDYLRGDSDQKAALRGIIMHRTADYDTSKIADPSLRAFIEQIRSGS
jgi:hypothetical protein